MKNVLLYNVTTMDDMPGNASVPLAYVLLEEYLRFNNIGVLRYDYLWDSPKSSPYDFYYEYDLAGFQLTYSNAEVILKMLRKWVELDNKPIIVFGGVLASAIAIQLIERYHFIDVVVIAEGEDALLQLAQKKPYEIIPGIVYRDDSGKITYNKGQKPIPFDNTSIPKQNFLLSMSKTEVQKVSIRIQTARGCLGGCSFCNNSYKNRLDRVTTKVWRGMSPERVVREIDYLYTTYGVKIINFVDPSFEDPGKKGKNRIEKIANLLIEKDLKISFKVNMRAETFTDSADDLRLLKLLKKAGMDIIILGIEACTDEELKIFGKNSNVEKNTKAYFRLKQMNSFFVNVGYITIHPYSTIESLYRSYGYINKLGESFSFNIFLAALIPLRGTNIYDRMHEDNLITNHDDILQIPKYKFINPKIALLCDAIQSMKIKYPIFLQLNNTVWEALNVKARATNRVFEGMLNNEKVNLAFNKFSSFINDEIFYTLGEKNYTIQKRMLELLETNWSEKKFDELFNESYIQYLVLTKKRIENEIFNLLTLINSEGYDISILQLKPWGAYCQYRTKLV